MSASTRPTRWSSTILLATLAVMLLAAGAVKAQTGGGFDLSWFTFDGGGTTASSAGGYSLGGTLGQPDAGDLQGGAYTLAGGFWDGPLAPKGFTIQLPLVLRNRQ